MEENEGCYNQRCFFVSESTAVTCNTRAARSCDGKFIYIKYKDSDLGPKV